jgi:hypothetical protein
MNPAQFWHEATASQSSFYYYWSGSLERIDPTLQADVHPLDVVVRNETMCNASATEGQLNGIECVHRRNLWWGSANITAQLHYDSSFNMYTQIYGKKAFLLVPPEYISKVYLHHAEHPCYRQSIVNFSKIDFKRFPLLAKEQIPMQLAVLEPGDVLFLPPFWLHRVTALTHSMSMNVWNDHQFVKVYDKLEAVPLPLEENWEPRVFRTAFALYIRFLTQYAHAESTAEMPELLERVYEQSFHPLYGPVKCFTGAFESRIDMEMYRCGLACEKAEWQIASGFKQKGERMKQVLDVFKHDWMRE